MPTSTRPARLPIKEPSGARLAIMKEDAQAIEDGGRDVFHFGADWKVMGFPAAPVDRVLRDRYTIRIGEVLLTGFLTSAGVRPRRAPHARS
jgi:metallo-beta-lactamase class B